MSRSGVRGACVMAALPLLAVACTGQITDKPGSVESGAGGTTGGNRTPGTGGTATAAQPGDPTAPNEFTHSPGLRRLTRSEYVNTVSDLLGVTISRDELPKELVVAGHSQIAGAQKTGYDDTNTYFNLAERAAEAAAAKLAMQVNCADAACYRTWAQGFLLRAFRGPVPAAVLDRYAPMLTAMDAGTTSTERLTTFLVAVLSSPHFLYRKEIGTGSDPAVKSLSQYEVATRLSYLVWQSTPDPELLDAAAKGALGQPAQRLAQLDRLLKDPRAAQGLRSFVSDWMGLHDNHLAEKTTEVLAGTGSNFPALAQRAFDLLVDDVLAARETAKFSDLLQVDFAFANATLAKVMGSNQSPMDFAKIMLNTSERRGILTQPLVIGAHSKESGASPFPLGKFIYENVLCEEIPPPPAMFPAVEDTTTATQTLRQRLEAMTANEPCFSCHVRIGPPGFAFLPFDPIGRYKNVDARGQAYDTTGELVMKGVSQKVPFNGASELGAKLAVQPAVQRCIARRLYRWTFGRFESEAEHAVVEAIENTSASSAAALAGLMRKVVEGPGFGQVRLR